MKRKFANPLCLATLIVVFVGCQSQKLAPAPSVTDHYDQAVGDAFAAQLQKDQAATQLDPVVGSATQNSDTGQKSTVEQVFYATDRRRLPSPTNHVSFGTVRERELQFGSAWVSIPRDHRMGELESPLWYKFEFTPDPEKHIVVLNSKILRTDAFIESLKRAFYRSPQKEVFLFVHGYNVNFDDSIRTTAQLTYDLGFKGVSVAFSWPSQGTLRGYTKDEENAAWSVRDLQHLLELIAEQVRPTRIHVLAHSMGNRILVDALEKTLRSPATPFRTVSADIIMAAPDVDAERFKRDILPSISSSNAFFSLYASSKDIALACSKVVHGYPRAGDAGDSLVLSPLIETIDASAVDTSLIGHSYYSDERTIVSDIFLIVQHNLQASQRNLKQRDRNGQKYWAIRP